MIARSLVTFSPLPGGSLNTLLLLIASTIGATVTPWMVFFQQSASADKGLTHRDIRHGRLDTVLGGALAAVFGCGALIAGATLAGHPGAGIQGLAGAGFPAAPGAGVAQAARLAAGTFPHPGHGPDRRRLGCLRFLLPRRAAARPSHASIEMFRPPGGRTSW